MLTRMDVATIVANHGNTGGETFDPDDEDYRLADLLIREIAPPQPDPHGYIAGTRMAVYILFAVLATAALTIWL